MWEQAAGIVGTAGIGYMAYIHKRVQSHETALATVGAKLHAVEHRIEAVDLAGANRHREIREDFREVKESLSDLTRHLLGRVS